MPPALRQVNSARSCTSSFHAFLIIRRSSKGNLLVANQTPVFLNSGRESCVAASGRRVQCHHHGESGSVDTVLTNQIPGHQRQDLESSGCDRGSTLHSQRSRGHMLSPALGDRSGTGYFPVARSVLRSGTNASPRAAARKHLPNDPQSLADIRKRFNGAFQLRARVSR